MSLILRQFRSSTVFLLLLLLSSFASKSAETSFMQIRNGYFWDPQTQDYFLARGIAYQLWNPPVGANQSFEQLTYDLAEFKKNHVNSVRCEMVWGELETAPDVYDWSRADFLVSEAERLGLKLFVLIGFQYPPAWFPERLRGINALGLTPAALQCLASAAPASALDCFPAQTRQLIENVVPPAMLGTLRNALVTGAQSGTTTGVLDRLRSDLSPEIYVEVSRLLISDVINYEDPEARAAYTAHLAAVAGRYKNSAAIAGWILGNEYAYFDLWEDPAVFPVRRFLGFDALSQQKFRDYLTARYGTIAALNQGWQTSYPSFNAIFMPTEYPINRDSPAYFDLIQWRERSVADFVAAGVVAARQADPNHLQSYSMVGALYNGRDANNTAEDAATIVARCRDAGAPLDFWSLNNYAHAAVGSDFRSGDFGIGKYQAESGLPVMISETGFSSTEDLFDYPYAGLRQAKAVPGGIWESFVSGAIGTHLFHWNDRSQYQQGYFLRERGFGIVGQNRAIKPEVYTNTMNMFRRMAEIRIDQLLGASSNPPPNVQFFWSTNSDLVWPRANLENGVLWGALKRAGYQPGIIDDADFDAGAYTNAPALLLSRAYQLDHRHLQEIFTRVVPAGIHVHSNADLPGQYDKQRRLNPNWNSLMSSIFGLATTNAVRGVHAGATAEFHLEILLQGSRALSPLPANYNARLATWQVWHNVGVTDGAVIVRHSGVGGAQPNTPALVTKTNSPGMGKTAVTTFAMGDAAVADGVKESNWDFRAQWLQAIYGTHFGITPAIRLTGTRATQVTPDYRILRNGTILLSLLNGGTNSASVSITAPTLLQGRTVENLTQGGILERQSDGVVDLTMQGDDYILLYAYQESGPATSLIQTGPSRIWFDTAPVVVHPRAAPYSVAVGFDTEGAVLFLDLQFESADGRALSRSATTVVTGKNKTQLQLPIPDFNAEDPAYRSSADGGSYYLRASLSGNSGVLSQTRVPVQLAWAVRPLTVLPFKPTPAQTYTVSLEWEDLPAIDANDPTPFDRLMLWDSNHPTNHAYVVTLNLHGTNGVLASKQIFTRAGTGTGNVSITVPPSATGPMDWHADVRPVTSLLTHDVFESFEGRDRGAMWPSNLTSNFIAPWITFNYSSSGQDLWQNEGVQLTGTHGSQSAFLVITNPPGQSFSGFGLSYRFPDAPWALPSTRADWSNWRFSFDFKEDHGYAADLQLQIKNDDPTGSGKWLQLVVPYTPGPDGWAHLEGTLSQFVKPPGLFGVFDPSQFTEIVLAVAMKTGSVQYVGSFDNIRFDGPDQPLALGGPIGFYASGNDAGYVTAIMTANKTVRISWTGAGALQFANQVQGPWAAITGAVSPIEIPVPQGNRFYRLER